MNLLDMLDRLEAGITALRARTLNGNQPAVARKRGAKRKKASAKKKMQKQPAPMALFEPEGEGKAAEPAARITGKRQALGRSLMQLRRPHGDAPGPH